MNEFSFRFNEFSRALNSCQKSRRVPDPGGPLGCIQIKIYVHQNYFFVVSLWLHLELLIKNLLLHIVENNGQGFSSLF